jgi:polysaccharide pyruvyl transferase WcaK-like protein
MDARTLERPQPQSASSIALKPLAEVAIYGNFGSTNFGNDSTLQAILHNLRCFYPNAEVTCICTGPEAVVRNHQIKAIPVVEKFAEFWAPRSRLTKLLRLLLIGLPSEPYRWLKGFVRLRRIDAVIIPGTGLLNDAWGVLGWGQYNLFKWALIAKLCGCKVIFVSVGAGPIYTTLGRFFIKSALGLADFRSYRDKSSKQCLESIGFHTKEDRVDPDLVFSLPEAAIPPHHTNNSRRPVAGIGLMVHAGRYTTSEPSDEVYVAYLESLVAVTEWLLARDYDVRLLIGDGPDRNTTQWFRGLLTERLSPGQEERIIEEPVASVEVLLSQIAATDIVVATRFHNVLLAMLCEKPVIAISFHHKCESLMSAMGLSKYCLDIRDLQAHTLIERFCDLERNADTLKPLVRMKVKECRRELNEQYKYIFNEICSA